MFVREMVNVLSDEKPGARENNGVVLSDSTSQSIYLFGGVSSIKTQRRYACLAREGMCMYAQPSLFLAFFGAGIVQRTHVVERSLAL